VKAFANDPQHAFPSQGQMKPERLEIARLKREVLNNYRLASVGLSEWL